MPLKLISDAAPGYLSGHDLILRPFVVPDNFEFWTRTSFTSSSSGYFPRLPTLSCIFKEHRKLRNIANSNLEHFHVKIFRLILSSNFLTDFDIASHIIIMLRHYNVFHKIKLQYKLIEQKIILDEGEIISFMNQLASNLALPNTMSRTTL